MNTNRNRRESVFLSELYKQFNAVTAAQKYNVMCESLRPFCDKIDFNPNISAEENVELLEDIVLDLDGVRQIVK